jgi:hypothetical protein
MEFFQKPRTTSYFNFGYFQKPRIQGYKKFNKHPTLVFTWKTLYTILMKIIKALHHKLFEPQFDNNSQKKKNGFFNQPNYTWQKKFTYL